MILETLILLITTIVAYFLYSHKRLKWYFDKRGIKYLPGVPVCGNILGSMFLKKHFLEDLADVYNGFPDEKYVGFQELTVPVILVRDPKLIKSILVKDFDHFTDHREFFNEEMDPLLGGSLVFMKGERWRDMRNTLSPAFTSSKMKYMLPFIVEISNNIVEYLHEHQTQDIDVDDVVHRFTNDVIASAGFGLHVNSLKDRDNEFYKIGSSLFNFNFKQWVIMILVPLFPEIGKKLGLRLFTPKVYNFFSNLIAASIELRKTSKISKPDMIQLLMEAKKGILKFREWTPEELAAQVFIFFTAGFETMASTLVLTIHELALHEDVQDKLYQECRSFEEQRELTFENLVEFKYMEAVINESLRKWSPSPILDRTCTKAYELPAPREGGKPCMMQPGEFIYLLMKQIHMDPKYWSEPKKFNPDRFIEENKHNIKPFTFIPFGVGPRGCIGLRFAMMELKVFLYHLILNFKIVKTAKTSDPIKLMPHNFYVRAVGGTSVRFDRR